MTPVVMSPSTSLRCHEENDLNCDAEYISNAFFSISNRGRHVCCFADLIEPPPRSRLRLGNRCIMSSTQIIRSSFLPVRHNPKDHERRTRQPSRVYFPPVSTSKLLPIQGKILGKVWRRNCRESNLRIRSVSSVPPVPCLG
jgi:hypothetical protein